MAPAARDGACSKASSQSRVSPGLPVIPVTFSASPARRLRSWDFTLLPKLFSKGLFVYGNPIVVPRDADGAAQEEKRLAIENELDRITDLADDAMGLSRESARPQAKPSVSPPLKVMLSAGEASGDRLGAGLARSLRALHPGIEIVGMGGDEMAHAGVRLVQHAREVAVVGFVEVIRHLPTIRRAMARLEAVLRRERPDVLVPIDYPDFNLRLAERARSAGVPVVYYVSPQVWAWRRGRVRTMRELVRRMLVLFPFESRFYEAEGVPATFVGHPAAASHVRAVRGELLPKLGLDPRHPVVALLPGSRVGEVGRLFPILLDAATALRRSHPSVQFVVPRAATIPEDFLAPFADRAGLSALAIPAGAYPGVLEVADAGAIASGTATLDAAVAELPFVAVYRMQSLSYSIAKSLVRVDHIALPNLVASERIVPELVQGECTPAAIAEVLRGLLDDPTRAEKIRRALARVRLSLSGDGAFDRAAAAVLAEVARAV
jgi:lipid-A-disaccharide synthase